MLHFEPLIVKYELRANFTILPDYSPPTMNQVALWKTFLNFRIEIDLNRTIQFLIRNPRRFLIIFVSQFKIDVEIESKD